MSKICLIGNSGLKSGGADGQTSKVRLYLRKIKDEGLDVDFVDLSNFTRRPLRVFGLIRKAIKKCDRIVLISAERGCKVLIPYINCINKRLKKPFILPLVGTSVLHYSIDHMDDERQKSFFSTNGYSRVRASKSLKKNLAKITWILPETHLISDVFRSFYGIGNVVTLNNFRDIVPIKHNTACKNRIKKIVYFSRVMPTKGIFDLVYACKGLKENFDYKLDIYGPLYLTAKDEKAFYGLLDNRIRYLGTVDPSQAISILAKYDLLVFPTRFACEGTPGVIVESFLAGTPVLSSSFPQARALINDGYDSLLYDFLNANDLKEKLSSAISNSLLLETLRNNVQSSSQKFTYEHERNTFLKYVCGIECNEKPK